MKQLKNGNFELTEEEFWAIFCWARYSFNQFIEDEGVQEDLELWESTHILEDEDKC